MIGTISLGGWFTLGAIQPSLQLTILTTQLPDFRFKLFNSHDGIQVPRLPITPSPAAIPNSVALIPRFGNEAPYSPVAGQILPALTRKLQAAGSGATPEPPS